MRKKIQISLSNAIRACDLWKVKRLCALGGNLIEVFNRTNSFWVQKESPELVEFLNKVLLPLGFFIEITKVAAPWVGTKVSELWVMGCIPKKYKEGP